MKKIILIFTGLTFLLLKNQAQTTIADIDGNIYNTITIGTQVWMKENLKVTRYNDGIAIPLVTDNTAWYNLTKPGYCWYKNDKATYGATYGALYNGYTVITNKLCPTGWHVPSDAEWTTLEYYLIANGYNYDNIILGNKFAKSLASTSNWTLSTNIGAVGNNDFTTKRNVTGFSALPAGIRISWGIFYYIGNNGLWWSSTELSTGWVWLRKIAYDSSNVGRYNYTKQFGLSVRCLWDKTIGIEKMNYPEKISIYPNPAIDKLTIEFAEEYKMSIQIYNIVGDCILQTELNNGAKTIDISSLAKGIYVIRMSNNQTTMVSKFVKE